MAKRKWYFLLSLFCIAVIINIIAWKSTAFCDFYVKHIFPFWLNTYGRFTGLFSFSVGELMIWAGLLLLLAGVILGVTFVISLISMKNVSKKLKINRFCRRFYSVFAGIIIIVFAVMTFNCSILYHCSPFQDKYMKSAGEEYTVSELKDLRDYVVIKANALSKLMPRDEFGTIVYDGDMGRTAVQSMQKLGDDYDQLSGYYPTPKPFAASEFVSQQYMEGYYFPFSMEANYNDVMQIMRKPSTMCHELAHIKGFIYEDEANLIGFLACVNSDDIAFQYSGYLSVLNYLDNDFYESINKNTAVYNSHVKISGQVKKDNVFLTEDAWKHVEKKAVVSTAAVKTISTEFIDKNLLVNGIEEGSLSYTRVVGLLLEYYKETELEHLTQEEFLVQGVSQ